MIYRPFKRITGEDISFSIEFPQTISDGTALFVNQNKEEFAEIDLVHLSGDVWLIEIGKEKTSNAQHEIYNLELNYNVNGKTQKFQIKKFLEFVPTWKL